MVTQILDPQFLLFIEAIFFLGIFLLLIFSLDLTNGLFFWLGALLIFGRERLLQDPILPDISLDRILWLILFGLFILQVLLKRRKLLIFNLADVAMFILCLVAFLSMVSSGSLIDIEGGIKLKELLTGYIIPFSIYFISKNLFYEESRVKRLKFILALFGIYLSLTAIFEHYHLFSLVFPRYIADPQVGIHFGRARGPFVNSAVNGTVLCMIFILVLYASLYLKGLQRKVALISLFLMPVAIFFTYTRSAWLGFLLALMWFMFSDRRFRKYIWVALLLISTFIAIERYSPWLRYRTSEVAPIFARINLDIAAWRIFLDHPFFGCGFGRFIEVAPYYMTRIPGIPYIGSGMTQHNTFSGVLAALGLFGFIPLLLIFIYLIQTAKLLYHQLPENEFFGKGLIISYFGVLVIYIINSLLLEMKFFQFPNSLFFLFSGILVGLRQRKNLYEQNL